MSHSAIVSKDTYIELIVAIVVDIKFRERRDNASVEDDGKKLLSAAHKGKLEIVETLIQNGVNVNTTTKSGDTALHLAASSRREKIVDLLLKSGANVNSTNGKRETPLHSAINKGNVKIIELLIKNGVNVNATDKDNRTALHIAVIYGFEDITKLLVQSGVDVDIQNKAGWTPLLTAALIGSDEIVSLLLQNGANPDIAGTTGNTPLIEAARYGREKVVDLLIERGVQSRTDAKWSGINVANELGETALYAASTDLGDLESKEKVVETLIKNGANVNQVNAEGRSPLHAASSNGSPKVVELLIKSGANVDLSSDFGVTPLILASSRDKEKTISLLIRNGANVNHANEFEFAPLHFAAIQGNEKIIDILLQNNANLYAKNIDGMTPMEVAMEEGFQWDADFFRRVMGTSAQKACEAYSADISDRIFDGQKAASGQFPWMAALGYINEDFKVITDCGGVIISEYFILTAAHCVDEDRLPVSVVLGKVSLNNTKKPRTEKLLIQEFIRHPDYSPATKQNDIALIRVVKRIYFSEFISPACLHTDLSDFDPLVKLTVTSWSKAAKESKKTSDVLLQKRVITMPLSQCNKTLLEYGKEANKTFVQDGIRDGQYCAHTPDLRNDSCDGGSGGPLQIVSPFTTLPKVIGIASFHVDCARTLPSVYTRVAYYVNWIQSLVWVYGDVPTFKPKINIEDNNKNGEKQQTDIDLNCIATSGLLRFKPINITEIGILAKNGSNILTSNQISKV